MENALRPRSSRFEKRTAPKNLSKNRKVFFSSFQHIFRGLSCSFSWQNEKKQTPNFGISSKASCKWMLCQCHTLQICAKNDQRKRKAEGLAKLPIVVKSEIIFFLKRKTGKTQVKSYSYFWRILFNFSFLQFLWVPLKSLKIWLTKKHSAKKYILLAPVKKDDFSISTFLFHTLSFALDIVLGGEVFTVENPLKFFISFGRQQEKAEWKKWVKNWKIYAHELSSWG